MDHLYSLPAHRIVDVFATHQLVPPTLGFLSPLLFQRNCFEKFLLCVFNLIFLIFSPPHFRHHFLTYLTVLTVLSVSHWKEDTLSIFLIELPPSIGFRV
jgi:hypothetical protein